MAGDPAAVPLFEELDLRLAVLDRHPALAAHGATESLDVEEGVGLHLVVDHVHGLTAVGGEHGLAGDER